MARLPKIVNCSTSTAARHSASGRFAGAVRDFKLADHLSVGAGGLLSVNFVPDALAPLYGGHNPLGAMAFVRMKLD